MGTKTLAELRTRVRQRANMERSTFVSDSELNIYINTAYTHLYDLLLNSYGDEYFSSNQLITKVGETTEYSLPSDFYKVITVSAISSNRHYPLKKIDTLSSVYGRLNTSASTFSLNYVPTFTEVTADAGTFDIQNGWDDWVTIHAAIKCLSKEESDIAPLMAELGETGSRIQRMGSSRDIGQPMQVIDVRAETSPYSGLGYMVKANNLVIVNLNKGVFLYE